MAENENTEQKFIAKRNKDNKLFEKSVLDHNPSTDVMWDHERGRYVNIFTQQQWYGFRAGLAAARQKSSGFCIIGKATEDGIKVSEKPFVHAKYANAKVEANRLLELEPEARFVIFQSVAAISVKQEQQNESSSEDNAE